MSRRTTPAALAALLLAHAAWGAYYVHRTSFPDPLDAEARVFCLWDDAMISMTYARNLALGHGLVWNPGEEPVQGYSNLGVTLAMAALHALPLASRHVSLAFQLLNLVLLLGVLLLVWQLGRRHLAADSGLGLSASLAVALCAPLGFWSLQGADVGFVALWLTGSLALLAVPARGARPGGDARRLWAVAPGIVLRSDAFVFYLALWLAPLLERDAPAGARARRLLHGGAALAVFWGGTLLFGWLQYGEALPNTYYLKATGIPRALMWTRGLAQLGYWLGGAAALVLAGVAALRWRHERIAVLSLALVATALAYHVWVGGDWGLVLGGRHLVPVAPALLLLATAGARLALERVGALAPRARRALLPAAAAALGLLLSPPALLREWFDPRQPTLYRYYNVKNYRFATYLESFTYPDTSVAVHWAGVIPYFSRRPAIDVLGKSDRHIAHLEVEEFRPGHSKYDWDYVIEERRPDILDAPSRGLETRGDLLGRYDRVSTGQPGYAGLSFYLRREAAQKLTDPDARRVPAPIREAPEPDPS